MSTGLPPAPSLKTCPACGYLYGEAFARCPRCGGTGNPKAFQARRKGIGVLVLAVIFVIGIFLVGALFKGGGKDTITGTFISWAPVDAGHGYATVRFHNAGDEIAKATCTVEVTTDFGDAGWDYVEISLGPGESQTGRVALTVQNDGAANVTHGVVKDC